MKKSIIVSIFLMMSSTLFSQEMNPSKELTREEYLKKSKNQKIAGIGLLAGGGTLCVFATLVAVDDLADDVSGFMAPFLAPGQPPPPHPDKNNKGLFSALAITGTAAIVGSISLFIAAGRNKRKAASVSFKNEKTLQVQSNSFVYRFVPSVSLKIGL